MSKKGKFKIGVGTSGNDQMDEMVFSALKIVSEQVNKTGPDEDITVILGSISAIISRLFLFQCVILATAGNSPERVRRLMLGSIKDVGERSIKEYEEHEQS